MTFYNICAGFFPRIVRGFGHLAMNMITLYFFGMEAALLLGARYFLNLYILGGSLSGVCWYVSTARSHLSL